VRRSRPAGKKKNPRIPTDDPAVLRILHPVILDPIQTRVLDASKEGIKLEVPKQLDVGALVQVRLQTLVLIGEVRHCQPFAAAFHAGVHIREVVAAPSPRHPPSSSAEGPP
jgi:PilZ domain